MRHINEKIGYIDKNVFNLNNIVNTVVKFIYAKKQVWEDTYIANKKPNMKNIGDFKYALFLFDLHNDKLGTIKVILVNVINEASDSFKFEGFIENESNAFYDADDSTVNKKRSNCGYIYVYYNFFDDYRDNKDELIQKLTTALYHEVRHYYDHIVGVFSGSLKELAHINLIAYELDINKKRFNEIIKTNNKDNSYTTLLKFIYVSDPSELNAWYHSFVQTLLQYTQEHPEGSKKDILKYIDDIRANKAYPAFLIYSYRVAYENLNSYKYVINSMCGNDPVKLWYYISTTLNSINPSDRLVKKLNDLFETKYLNYFYDDINMDIFADKLKQFINDHYIKYVYAKILPRYMHTVKNMQKFISTLY